MNLRLFNLGCPVIIDSGPSLRSAGMTDQLIVPVDPLAALVALLRLDREGRDGARFEPLQRDRLAGFLAIAVGAVVDALDRGVDLGDQLALTVARPQLDGTVRLGRGAVGKIGMVLVLVLQML